MENLEQKEVEALAASELFTGGAEAEETEEVRRMRQLIHRVQVGQRTNHCPLRTAHCPLPTLTAHCSLLTADG